MATTQFARERCYNFALYSHFEEDLKMKRMYGWLAFDSEIREHIRQDCLEKEKDFILDEEEVKAGFMFDFGDLSDVSDAKVNP